MDQYVKMTPQEVDDEDEDEDIMYEANEKQLSISDSKRSAGIQIRYCATEDSTPKKSPPLNERLRMFAHQNLHLDSMLQLGSSKASNGDIHHHRTSHHQRRPLTSSMKLNSTVSRSRCYILFNRIVYAILILLALFLVYHTGRFYDYVIRSDRQVVSYKTNKSITISISKNPPILYGSKWFVSNPKCRIPSLDPWDTSVEDEFSDLQWEIKCDKNDPSLTYVQDNLLYFNDSVITQLNKNVTDCCYSYVKRVDGDDDLDMEKKCTPITGNGIVIPYQLIKIRCEQANYTGVHSFIVPLSDETQIDELMHQRLSDSAYSNVLIIGLDTVSRANSYRQLNQTLTTLEQLFGDQMLEFRGYNKVAENTFPNLVPLLTGHTPGELINGPVGCWRGANMSDDRFDRYMDGCSFMWNEFGRAGYRTFYHEDWAKASTFNYLKPGFNKQPTNFYQRPFYLIERDINSDVEMSCSECVHGQPLAEINLNHLKQFLHTYKRRPYFVFDWLNCPQHESLSALSRIDKYYSKFFRDIHELVNERTFVVFLSDHGWRYNPFVSTYAGHLEASLPMLRIIVPRRFRAQHPHLVAALASYQDRLITPFDLHETLRQILDLSLHNSTQQIKTTNEKESNEKIIQIVKTKRSSNKAKQNNRSNWSMFDLSASANPMVNRSCEEAGIPDNYCICQQMEPISTNVAHVRAAARFLLDRFNKRIRHSNHSQLCSHLRLSSILSAKIGVVIDEHDGEDSTARNHTEIIITIKTEPGGGQFEEVVRMYGANLDKCGHNFDAIVGHDTGANDKLLSTIDGDNIVSVADDSARQRSKQNIFMRPELNAVCKFRITGTTIARLNSYGNSSSCVVVGDSELRKICYCRDQLTTKNH